MMKKSNKLSIGFTGDIAFDEYTSNYYDNPDKIDKRLLSFLGSNDYNVIDLESPVTLSNETEKEALFHKLEPKHLDYIKKIIKCPIADLANNHMMDYGYVGLNDTLKYLKIKNIPYIGAGKNLRDASNYIILGDDVKVGVIAVEYKDYYIASSENAGPFHESCLNVLKERVFELKNKVDWIVVVYHGGEEFLRVPMPYTKKLLYKILDFGVDIIVAHHPHVVEGYEKVGKKMIFYSLGNFIFDTDFQRAQKYTDEGVLLSIKFSKNDYSFENKCLKIDRKNEKIVLSDVNNNFKEIDKTNYSKLWRKEALRIREISNNKRKLRQTRISKYLGEGENKVVSFSYFESLLEGKDIKVEAVHVGLLKKIKNHRYVRLLRECFVNKKYRYYVYAKIINIFKK